jgi:hypothetical protein
MFFAESTLCTAARVRGHGLRANKNRAEFCLTRMGKNVQIRDYA